MHDIDFGDVLSTPAPVAASVATKTPQKKNLSRYIFFLWEISRKKESDYTARRTVVPKSIALLGGLPPPTLQILSMNFILRITYVHTTLYP